MADRENIRQSIDYERGYSDGYREARSRALEYMEDINKMQMVQPMRLKVDRENYEDIKKLMERMPVSSCFAMDKGFKPITAEDIVKSQQDSIKKQIEKINKKVDQEIKEAALKGYKVLVVKTTTIGCEKIENGVIGKQTITFWPMDSMEEAEAVFEGQGCAYHDLDLVREYMESEEYKQIERGKDGRG